MTRHAGAADASAAGERFDAWHQCWRRRGVLAVIQAVVSDATPQLFARPDRERALTDLRHLGELLQARSEQQPGAEALLGWLPDVEVNTIAGASHGLPLERPDEVAAAILAFIHEGDDV